MRGILILASIAAVLVLGMGCAQTAAGQNETAKCLANCTRDANPVCAEDNITYPSECAARCNGTEKRFEGACGSCKDTDGGKNATVKGHVTSDGGNYTDYCIVFESVEEYFCEGALAGKETIACPEGYECHDGTCVVKLPPIPEPDCHDSDGKDIYGKGSANASGNQYEDSCVDNKKVREYYCDQGIRSVDTDCPEGYGCEDGMCVKLFGNCTDTDSGNDIYNEGKVMVKSGLIELEFLDKCLEGDYVKEYYCTLGNYESVTVKCPKDYRCVQASCRQDVCMDSDGGYEIFRQGGVNKGDVVRRDECTDHDSGIEYYCDENNIINATFVCPAGSVCNNGRCED